MTIRIRLFAALREAVGRNEVDMELPEGATAEDAWKAPGLAWRLPSRAAGRASPLP